MVVLGGGGGSYERGTPVDLTLRARWQVALGTPFLFTLHDAPERAQLTNPAPARVCGCRSLTTFSL